MNKAMNKTDEKIAIEQLRAYIELDMHENGGVPSTVIAFDFKEISFKLKNSGRDIHRTIEHLNEVLGETKICQQLGGIYTLTQYEMSTVFLILANKVVSYTELFVPEDKIFAETHRSRIRFRLKSCSNSRTSSAVEEDSEDDTIKGSLKNLMAYLAAAEKGDSIEPLFKRTPGGKFVQANNFNTILKDLVKKYDDENEREVPVETPLYYTEEGTVEGTTEEGEQEESSEGKEL